MYFKDWFIFQTLSCNNVKTQLLLLNTGQDKPCRAQHVKNVDSQEKASAPL